MSRLNGITETWFRLFAIFTPSQKRRYLAMVVWGVVNAVLEFAGIAVLLHTILSILKPDFIAHNVFTSYLSKLFGINEQVHFVVLISSILFLAYIVKNVFIIIINKLQIKFAFDVTDEITTKRYEEIAHNDLLYFSNRKSSEIINELFSALLFLPESTIIPSILLLSEVSIVILAMSAVLFYNPVLFVFTLLSILPAAIILIYVNRKILGKQGSAIHKMTPELHENISELAVGVADIKLWRGIEKFKTQFNSRKEDYFDLKKSMYINSNFIPLRIYEVIAIFGILCVVLYTVFSNEGNQNLISYISIYAGISFRLLPSVNRIIGSFNTLSMYRFKLDYLIPENLNNDIDLVASRKSDLVFEDSIELKDIQFSYKKEDELLHNLSIKLKKGEFVGLVGPSGCGKSTLINIITTLVPPDSGEILLDGKLIKEEEMDSYRYLFSFVKQNVFMLNKSILANIAFLEEEEEIEHNRVKKCLEEVNLWDWVSQLEDGLDTRVGELGSKISGGQKQRIAIARALYKNAQIFIFDEATNNLDKESIRQTLLAIQHLKDEGKTAIFITHKEDELRLCDRVFRLENKMLYAN
jgi:ABC-type multidrug transport system fused ATPase/permease subunit